MEAKMVLCPSIDYVQIIFKFPDEISFSSRNIPLQLQKIENVEESRALFASSDGIDILSHIVLRSVPSKADMTCKQVVLRYLTISYEHCFFRCKGNVFFFILGLTCFYVNVFFF